MKIQTLLEDLYRYQYEWSKNEEDVVQVPARSGRVTEGAVAIVPYSVHYAMYRIGMNAPRRWNSSFTTNSPDQSMFLGDGYGEGGIRKIVIPDDHPVGFVYDDFNAHQYNEFNAGKIAHEIGEFFHAVPFKQQNRFQQTNIPKVFSGLSEFLRERTTNDEGYEKFVQLIELVDKLLTSYEQPTYTERMVVSIQTFIDRNRLGVATAATIPEGNYEVWFEGPYEAHKTTDLDDEDHDLDR